MKSFKEHIWENVEHIPIAKNKNVRIHHVTSNNHLRNIVNKSQYGEVRTLHFMSPEGFARSIAWDGAESDHTKMIHHHPEIGPKAAPDTHVRGNISVDEVDGDRMLAQFSHHGEQEDGTHTPPNHPHVGQMFSKHHETKPDKLVNAWGHTTSTTMSHKVKK
jgi:hypothetical protein